MINPAVALLSALVILAVLVMAFWPDRGLFWRLRRAFQASERVQAEDALKHLFDCEYMVASRTYRVFQEPWGSPATGAPRSYASSRPKSSSPLRTPAIP